MNTLEYMGALEEIKKLLSALQRSGYHLHSMTLEDGEEMEFKIARHEAVKIGIGEISEEELNAR